MAEALGISSRTLRREIITKKIPHIRAGRQYRFDEARVKLHLEAVPVEKANVLRFTPRKTRKVKSNFADMVGV